MSETYHLGALQLAIMRILWQRGEATVATVHAELHPKRGLAFSTIATMLRKMENKGVVTHRSEGRQFIFQPLVAEQQVRSGMLGDLTERLFEGDSAALVTQLLDSDGVDFAELERLKKIIAAKEKELGKDV